MTVQDLIVDCLTTIGELGQGETPSNEDLAYCLFRLNALIDSLSTQRIMLPSVTITTNSLTANVQAYALGTSGLVGVRPILVEEATIISALSGGGNVRNRLNPLTVQQWTALKDKGLTGVLPTDFYQDGAYPSINFYLHPIPSLASSIEFVVWLPITQFAAVGTTFAMPPGYQQMLTLMLIMEIADGFERTPSQTLIQNAQLAYARVQDINAQIMRGDFGVSRTLQGPVAGIAAPLGQVAAKVLTGAPTQ